MIHVVCFEVKCLFYINRWRVRACVRVRVYARDRVCIQEGRIRLLKLIMIRMMH